MDIVSDWPEESMPSPDTGELRAELSSRGYTALATGGVLAYADALGTLEGCVWVDPEDRAALDAILERAWPDVRRTSHRWDDDALQGAPSRWTLPRPARIAALAEAHQVELTPDAGEDTVRAILEAWEAQHDRETRRAEALWPPIEPDDAEYVPSEEDEVFYAAWLADNEPLTLDPEPFHP
jgi:hypothetical protein